MNQSNNLLASIENYITFITRAIFILLIITFYNFTNYTNISLNIYQYIIKHFNNWPIMQQSTNFNTIEFIC